MRGALGSAAGDVALGGQGHAGERCKVLDGRARTEPSGNSWVRRRRGERQLSRLVAEEAIGRSREASETDVMLPVFFVEGGLVADPQVRRLRENRMAGKTRASVGAASGMSDRTTMGLAGAGRWRGPRRRRGLRGTREGRVADV